MAKLFLIARKLRNYRGESGRQVQIRVRLRTGFEAEIPVYDYVNNVKVPICVRMEHWKKGFVTGGKYHLSVRDLNFLLQKVERNVKDAVDDLLKKNIKITRENILLLTYINEDNALINETKITNGEIIVNEDGGAFASLDELLDHINESDDPKFAKLKRKMGKKTYILDYWDGFIENYAPDSYNSPKIAIEQYIERTGDNCEASLFSAQWLNRFFTNILPHGYSFRKDGTNLKPYTISTLKKYEKHIKHFGDYLFSELKILSNQDYQRFKLNEGLKKQKLLKYESVPYNNTSALYKKEFDWFYSFQFTDEKLELARDMFVMQTWFGGLRLKDFLSLQSENFYKDSDGKWIVNFVQNKTDGGVINIVNQHYLDPLLAKYSSGFHVFHKPAEYNRLLKEAAKVAGLDRLMEFRTEYAKDSKATIEHKPIHEKILNNWARNCAVSILCELGFPDDRISSFIGHRDKKMIAHYKSVHQKEIKSMMEAVKPDVVTVL